jgi:hypothetical protein
LRCLHGWRWRTHVQCVGGTLFVHHTNAWASAHGAIDRPSQR